MRKTFLTFCTAALALLAVSSCGKIWDEFDAVHGQIDDLKAKIEALENKLNQEVETLNDRLGGIQVAFAQADADLKAALETKLSALDTKLSNEISSLRSELDALDGSIDGKLNAAEEEIIKAIADLTTSLNTKYEELKGVDAKVAAALVELGVTKVVKNSDGNAVITFADGTTIEVAADSNVNNEGLVTVVDGKWAVIGADGETTVLDAEVHPDTELTFKVDLDTKELLYSIDGKNYEKTGAYVSDEQFSVVNGVVEGDDYVTITIGGVEYNLPKVSTNKFQIQSGKAFFTEGQTKTFKVKSVGMISAFLANAPKGWDVAVSTSELTVTAPAADVEGADEEGLIEIWVLTDNGTTLLGTLSVTLQPAPFTITVDGENVTLDVTGMVIVTEDEWGTMETLVNDVVFGACPVDQFNPEAIIASLVECGWAAAPEGAFNNFDWMEYDFVSKVETTIPELLGTEFTGGSYVVWAVLRGYDAGFTLTASDFVLEYVNKVEVSVEATPSWNDIAFTIETKGADETFAMAMPKEMYEGYVNEYWSDEAIEMWEENGFGFEQLFFPGMLHYSPVEYFEGSYSGKVSTFGLEVEGYATEVLPGSDWVILVLPMTKDNKNDYRMSDVTVYEVSADDLMPNGSATVTLDVASAITDFTMISVPATTTGDIVYYCILSDEELELFELTDDDAILDYLLDNEVYMMREKEFDMYFPSLSLATGYTIAAFAIDSEGKYGQLAKAKLSTKAMPYNESLVASVESVVFSADNAKQVTVTYNVTGASKLLVYAGTSGPSCAYTNSSSTVSSWELKLLTQPANYQLSKQDVVDGKVTVTYNNYTTTYKYVYFLPYNVDEDGNVVAMAPATVVDLSTYAN